MYLDLLKLPPQAKKVGNWVIQDSESHRYSDSLFYNYDFLTASGLYAFLLSFSDLKTTLNPTKKRKEDDAVEKVLKCNISRCSHRERVGEDPEPDSRGREGGDRGDERRRGEWRRSGYHSANQGTYLAPS